DFNFNGNRVMRYYAIAAVAAVALVGVPAAASAQEDPAPTGPETKVCVDAQAEVDKLTKRVGDLTAEERVAENAALEAAKSERKAAREARDAAKAEVVRLSGIVDDPEAEPGRKEAAESKLPGARGALKAAEDALTARKADVEKAQEDLDADSEALAALRARLAVTVQGRDAACSDPDTGAAPEPSDDEEDRKSTRLNSSHVKISYAVFCLKKKKQPHSKPCTTRGN